MLNKKNKIQKKKEIEEVFKKGRSSFDSMLGVKVLKTNNNLNRFVVVVSTKVSKKATERNRLKRQLNEILRLNLKNIAQNCDFFILALPAIKDKKYHEIESVVLNHFKKLKALSSR